MTTTYNVWFGAEVWYAMDLVSEGQAGTTWTIPVDTLESGVTYFWRIDSINEYGTTKGDVWEFTGHVFAPPSSNLDTKKRLIAVGQNKLYYEDI